MWAYCCWFFLLWICFLVVLSVLFWGGDLVLGSALAPVALWYISLVPIGPSLQVIIQKNIKI